MLHKKLYTNLYTFSSVTKIGNYLKRALQAKLFDRFFPDINESAKILEIGSGRGEFAKECVRRGYEYTGIEPSDKFGEKLSIMGFNILRDKAPPINLSDNIFTLVHTADLIEHLNSFETVLDLLSECYRVLKQGGYLSIVAPNFTTLKDLFFEYEYQHNFITTEYRLAALLKDSGFHIVRCEKMLFPFLSYKYVQYVDRILAHTLIPFTRSSIFRGIIKGLSNEEVLFRIHKNMFDHIMIMAQKQ